MKKRWLLILSVVCLVSALALWLVVPVFAIATSANIEKSQAPGPGANQVTSTITITNTNPSGGGSEDFISITDTIYHNNGGGTEGPIQLLGGTVTLAPNESKTVTYTWTVLAGDINTSVMDVANASGYPTGQPSDPPSIQLQVPNWISPTPELPAGILFGMGVLGLGGFVLINRRKSAAKI